MSKVYVVRSRCNIWYFGDMDIDDVVAVCSTPEKAHEAIREAYNRAIKRRKEDGYFVKQELDTKNGWHLEAHMEKKTSDLDNVYCNYIFDSIEMELDKPEMEDL